MGRRLVSPNTAGRQPEIKAAISALDRMLKGGSPHLLVSGEAGVGKSRFASDLAAIATARGVVLLRGACTSVGEVAFPYGPFVEALRELVPVLSPAELAEVVGSGGPDLARIAPEFGALSTDMPVQRDWLQARLFEALLGFLRRLSARRPVVFVVEDLHWADAATREAVAFLARNLRVDRVLMVLTFRSDELDRRHPLLPWLAELERTGRVERIELRRLDRDETRELLTGILGEEPVDETLDRILRRSGGNPFFVEELLAADDGPTGRGSMPSTLREILLARLATVSERAQPILAAVAVAGRQIDHDLVAAVSDLADKGLITALKEAVASQILITQRPDDLAEDVYAFRHALLQEVAYDELLPGEKRRLHLKLAEALAARRVGSGAGAAAHWAELAHHWRAARNEVKAFEASLRAAEAAEASFAFGAALGEFERALDLWPGLANPAAIAKRDQAETLAQAARVASFAGLPHRAIAFQREAIAMIDARLQPTRLALMHAELSRSLWSAGDSAAALAAGLAAMHLVRDAFPTPERARVIAGFAQLKMLLGDVRESAALCGTAIDIATEVGARDTEGHARNTLGIDLSAQGRCEDAIASLERARDIALEVRSFDDIGRSQLNLISAKIVCGDLAGAVAMVDEGIRVAAQYGLASSYGTFIRDCGVTANFELGQWATALRLARDRFDNARSGAQSERYGLARSAPLLVALGEFDLAREQISRLGEMLAGRPVEAQFSSGYHEAKAELALWEGRPGEALDVVEHGLLELSSTEWDWFLLRLYGLAARAAADCADLERARRDDVAERRAVARGTALRAPRSTLVVGMMSRESQAQADETRAVAATANAEDRRLVNGADVDAWHTASEGWRARARPYPLAYCLWREAEAALAGGRRKAAAASLRDADAISATLGAKPLRAAIASLARRGRIDIAKEIREGDTRRSSAGTADRRTPLTQASGLTNREIDVLGLLTLGRRNRQIAQELFISENTVGVHVSSILGKLGVASRTEAAAIAVRIGLEQRQR